MTQEFRERIVCISLTLGILTVIILIKLLLR